MTRRIERLSRAGEGFAAHDAVTHSKKEYVRGNVHTNTVEGFFSLLKRGITASYPPRRQGPSREVLR